MGYTEILSVFKWTVSWFNSVFWYTGLCILFLQRHRMLILYLCLYENNNKNFLKEKISTTE